MTIKTDILETPSGGPVTLTGQMSARAWINHNQVTTASINGSLSVSSITDVSTGVTTVNMSITMSDANYAITSALIPYHDNYNGNTLIGNPSNPPTTSEFRQTSTAASNATQLDSPGLYASVLGDLA
jgi:hypothetical protein